MAAAVQPTISIRIFKAALPSPGLMFIGEWPVVQCLPGNAID